MRNVTVILPAAGSGRRFGHRRPKQFQRLRGVPLFRHALNFFSTHPSVAEIVIAVPPEDATALERRLSRERPLPALRIVEGGATRQESVARALEAAAAKAAWIAVHDVVRPFPDRRLFARLLRAALEYGAAIPGLPMTDTLKRVDSEGLVVATVPRADFVQVQTPQVFAKSVLTEAIRSAQRDGYEGTDEAMLVERIGGRVKIVAGSRWNIKVTLPEDLLLARWIGVRQARRKG